MVLAIELKDMFPPKCSIALLQITWVLVLYLAFFWPVSVMSQATFVFQRLIDFKIFSYSYLEVPVNWAKTSVVLSSPAAPFSFLLTPHSCFLLSSPAHTP